MIPNISGILLSWLENNSKIMEGINRGIEREALRIDANGSLAKTCHPKLLGSALTHKWITTDFAESLLEIITPPIANDINYTLTFLRDLHRYISYCLDFELMWPFSMPCFIKNIQHIKIAQYGKSNIGLMKTLYRKGLKNRYGTLMHMMSGIHYNFSLPLSFWEEYSKINNNKENKLTEKDFISYGYLKLIRNYYRFGWIIPYLFGASPGMCQSFLYKHQINLPFEKTTSGLIYLPYATSLRLNELGYINKLQNKLSITFNSIEEYTHKLKWATNTPLTEYLNIGLKKNDKYLQLNTNILQLENELYTLIRPKRSIHDNELISDALLNKGIEYIEVRSLDINPFSPIGINKMQIYFLDLFLVWCILIESPKMSSQEMYYSCINWNKVILEGRKPGLMLYIGYDKIKQPLVYIGELILNDLKRIAKIVDSNYNNDGYQQVCNKLLIHLKYPEQTFSARLLKKMKKYGINKLGLILASKYQKILNQEQLEILNKLHLDNEKINSLEHQYKLEISDVLSFEDYLIKNIFNK